MKIITAPLAVIALFTVLLLASICFFADRLVNFITMDVVLPIGDWACLQLGIETRKD